MRRPVLLGGLLLVVLAACVGAETSGIEGRVLLGPNCPVLQEGSPCPDTPTPAEVKVSTVDGARLIELVRTGPDGTFRIALDPGDYEVQALPLEGDTIVFGKPQTVTVPRGSFVRIDLALDTGIR